MNETTPCGCGRPFEHHHGLGGMIPGPAPTDAREAPLKAKPYRGMTPEEDTWTNPKTPRKLDKRVRLVCPDGVVENTDISFEDGTPLKNVLRTVISLESPIVRGPDGKMPDGKAYIFISQFHNKIGRVVYSVAEALVGRSGTPHE